MVDAAEAYSTDSSTILNLTVATVPGGTPPTGGGQYFQIAADGLHQVLYQATYAPGLLMFNMQTAQWVTVLKAYSSSGGSQYYSVCVSEDGTTVYAGNSYPTASVYKEWFLWHPGAPIV